MVCEELDQLEWDFIQARAGSPDMDSLGWTDREFSCLDAILDHKREGASRRPLFWGLNVIQRRKARIPAMTDLKFSLRFTALCADETA